MARDIPATIGLLDDRIAATGASRRFVMFAIGTLGALALILAAIGIYGVLAYSVASRGFEIGVRMALGATPGRVRRQFLLNATTMAGAGVVVGILLGFAAPRYIGSLLYGVSPFSPATYALASLISLGRSRGRLYPRAAIESRRSHDRHSRRIVGRHCAFEVPLWNLKRAASTFGNWNVKSDCRIIPLRTQL